MIRLLQENPNITELSLKSAGIPTTPNQLSTTDMALIEAQLEINRKSTAGHPLEGYSAMLHVEGGADISTLTRRVAEQEKEIAVMRTQLAQYGDIQSVSGQQVMSDMVQVAQVLSSHVQELASIAESTKAGRNALNEKESLLQTQAARDYYFYLVSGLTSAFGGAKGMDSGFVRTARGKTGHIGEAASVLGSIVPIVGSSGKALGAVLKTIDEKS